MKLSIEVDGQLYDVELSEQVVDALRSIAKRNGLTVEQALAQAIVNEKVLEDLVDAGSKLLIEKGDKIRHLEFA